MKTTVTMKQQNSILSARRAQLNLFKFWSISMATYLIVLLLHHVLNEFHGNDPLSIIWVLLFVLNIVIAPMLLGLLQLVSSFTLGFTRKIKYFRWHFGIALIYLTALFTEGFAPHQYTIQRNLGETIGGSLAFGIPIILAVTFCYVIFFHHKKADLA